MKALIQIDNTDLIQVDLKGMIFVRNDEYDAYAKVVDVVMNKYNEQEIHYVTTAPEYYPSWRERVQRSSAKSFFSTYSTVGYSSDTISLYQSQALSIISGQAQIMDFIATTPAHSGSGDIVEKNSKENLLSLQKDLEESRKQVEIIQKMVHLEMLKRKAELEKIKNGLQGVITEFWDKIKRIQKVITTIELYLGIEEELVQLTDGENAHHSTPISFRQLVLYIDEELGVYQNGGLDFRDIDWFDEWIVKDENYEKILPEKKGIVALHPRRYYKEYGRTVSAFEESEMNRLNLRHTYLLIRNGDKLYRVFSEKLVTGDVLFPTKSALQKLSDPNLNLFDKEKNEKQLDMFKKQTALLQGLIDRTEVFTPLPKANLNLFRLDSVNSGVEFIYDAEPSLTEGRVSFRDFRWSKNSAIKRGTRIFFTGQVSKKTLQDRLFYDVHEYNLPNPPKMGIYEVEARMEETHRWVRESDFLEKYSDHKVLHTNDKYFQRFPGNSGPVISEKGFFIAFQSERLYFLYQSDDEIYGGAFRSNYEPHKRKKRISFEIFSNDEFILNYDQLDLDDVDYYLNNRVDRVNYLSMMPILKNIKEMRIIEIEQEGFFAQLVIDHFSRKGKLISREKVYEGIEWWKYKCLWKRPVSKDDSKAFRMIVKYLE